MIAQLASGVRKDLPQLIALCRIITRRASDILAFFDHPGTSNGPAEAINAVSSIFGAPLSASGP